ncbi:MAG TPA: serine protease [Thermoanaerobaculia bacterium]
MLRPSLAAPLAAALVLSALPARAADPDVLKKQTVQIRVYREDAEPDFGSGVILCQREELAYILTAHHVIYGESQGEGLRSSRRDVRKTEIRFFRDLTPMIVEDRDKGEDKIGATPFAAKDLVLLTVAVPQQLPNAAPGAIPPATDLNATAGRREFPVTAIGYAKSSAREWVEERGAMTRRDGIHLLHDAQIEKGFSGGPLFDESGALVGLNVRFASRAAGGENTFGSREGVSLAIDEIVESIDGKLPAGCIENLAVDNSEEEAHKIYKRAIREVSLKNWCAAVPLLRDAIQEKSLEGGRVHLQGMRYTEYLPHYHLGLAYYHLERYRDAHRELTTSETQRVVQDDKRYRRLKKVKPKAYEKRNAEPSASQRCILIAEQGETGESR